MTVRTQRPLPDPLDACGDALRRALHAEADPLVPAFNGLERIHHRMYHPSISDRIARASAAVFSALPIRICKENTHG